MPSFYDIIRFIVVFHFFFIAIFLVTFKKGKSLPNNLFAVFLFSKAFCFSNSLLFTYKSALMYEVPHLYYIGESFEFIIGPALYFYVRSVTNSEFRLKAIHSFHLIPFAISLIFLSVRYHFNTAGTKIELLQGYIMSYYEFISNMSAIYIHFIIYSVFSIILLVKHRQKLKEYYSSLQAINHNWLVIILSGFILLWGTAFIRFLLRLSGVYFYYPWDISTLLLFLFTNVILFKGLKQSQIFFQGAEKPVNGKSLLSDKDMDFYFNKLNQFMRSDKPYLQPTITLNELAEKLSISPRYLSYVINKSFNQNFHDYINKHRIEETKRILADPRNHKTVLEILYESGFNSKSVFNSAFKKHVGMTPSQYKSSLTGFASE